MGKGWLKVCLDDDPPNITVWTSGMLAIWAPEKELVAGMTLGLSTTSHLAEGSERVIQPLPHRRIVGVALLERPLHLQAVLLQQGELALGLLALRRRVALALVQCSLPPQAEGMRQRRAAESGRRVPKPTSLLHHLHPASPAAIEPGVTQFT